VTDTVVDPLADDQQQHPSTPKNRKGPPKWLGISTVLVGSIATIVTFMIAETSGPGVYRSWWGSILPIFLIPGLAYMLWTVLGSALSTSAVERERTRLEEAIEWKTRATRPDATTRVDRNLHAWISNVDNIGKTGKTGGVGHAEDSKPSPVPWTQLIVPAQVVRRANEDGVRFSTLLLDYYAHGLVQARRSSMASLWSSVLGIIVIITGVGIAIFRTDSGIAASITVSLAGVVTNAVGVLFHQQANRALAHMETQTTSLRQDMRDDQDGYDAVDLLGNVSDPLMRDRLLAAVVLQLSKATLPPAEEAARGRDDTQPETAPTAG